MQNEKETTDPTDFPLPLDEHGVPIDPPPPSPEQVMQYAKALWGEPTTRTIFERMSAYGLPTNEEFDHLEAFRDQWLKEKNMESLNLNGFFGANMLLRRIISEQIAGLDAEEAMAFLREDYPRNTIKRSRPGSGIFMVPVRIEESMWLANYIKNRTDFWTQFAQDYRAQLDGVSRLQSSAGYAAFMKFWQQKYAPNYGLINRGFIDTLAINLLGQLALGKITDLASEEAWTYIRNFYPKINKQID